MEFYFMPKGPQVKTVMTEFEGNFGKIGASQQATAISTGSTSGGKRL